MFRTPVVRPYDSELCSTGGRHVKAKTPGWRSRGRENLLPANVYHYNNTPVYIFTQNKAIGTKTFYAKPPLCTQKMYDSFGFTRVGGVGSTAMHTLPEMMRIFVCVVRFTAKGVSSVFFEPRSWKSYIWVHQILSVLSTHRSWTRNGL
eukprot:6520939-Pyramimonas_sp.AAC.1